MLREMREKADGEAREEGSDNEGSDNEKKKKKRGSDDENDDDNDDGPRKKRDSDIDSDDDEFDAYTEGPTRIEFSKIVDAAAKIAAEDEL